MELLKFERQIPNEKAMTSDFSDCVMHRRWIVFHQFHTIQGKCNVFLFTYNFSQVKSLLYPRHTNYVGVYSFRFSVHPFIRTFVRSYVHSFVCSFVRLSITGSKFLR